MNALLPENLAHYEHRTSLSNEALNIDPDNDDVNASVWDGPAASKMSAKSDMPWVAPDPLR